MFHLSRCSWAKGHAGSPSTTSEVFAYPKKGIGRRWRSPKLDGVSNANHLVLLAGQESWRFRTCWWNSSPWDWAYSVSILCMTSLFAAFATFSSIRHLLWRRWATNRPRGSTMARTSSKPLWSPCKLWGWQGNPIVTTDSLPCWACNNLGIARSSMRSAWNGRSPWAFWNESTASSEWSIAATVGTPKNEKPTENPPRPEHKSIIWPSPDFTSLIWNHWDDSSITKHGCPPNSSEDLQTSKRVTFRSKSRFTLVKWIKEPEICSLARIQSPSA